MRCSNAHCNISSAVSGDSLHFFRCAQCFGRSIFCGPCMVATHQRHPFHWPEAWVDSNTDTSIPSDWKNKLPALFGYFKRVSLHSLGLHVGLGHDGELCPNSHKDDAFTMTVLHTTGQHKINLLPCSCNGKDLWEQLLEVDIWPATETKPQTGFTIEVLRHQRGFNLRGKTSLKEYYDSLVDLTSAAELKSSISVGLDAPPCDSWRDLLFLL